jgi:autotransporter strand-loop-strand O-heptosyltransferase
MSDIEFIINFRNGAYLEITGGTDELFVVDFYDSDTGILELTDTILTGTWIRTQKKYYVNWYVVVKDLQGSIVFEERFDPKGKDIVIDIDNRALGDTIGFIPYCEVFRKKHNCNLTVLTNFYKIFEDMYPEIKWLPLIDKSPEDFNCYAYYLIVQGISGDLYEKNIKKINYYYSKNIPIKYIDNLTFHNTSYHREHPYKIPLQKIATNILNLEFEELRPIFPMVNSQRPIEKKYICISEFASSEGMKHWNNKIGWKTLVDELQKKGYEVVSISKEKTQLKNVIKRNGDYDLTDRIWYLQHCEFFIGLGSGLSWLAWASSVKVVLIAGHSEKWVEFQENCIRIINEEVCHGCYNNSEHMDKLCCYHSSFCPEDKNFICTRAISPRMVINKIKEHNLI